MSKKLMFGALSALLPVALLVVAIGAGSASGKVRPHQPVTFTGAVSCNLHGTLSISPPALNSASSAYSLSFTGTNNHCKGLPYPTATGATGTTSLTQGGETLKKSTENFKFSIGTTANPVNLCSDLEYGAAAVPWGGGGGSITWLGTSPIAGTTLSTPSPLSALNIFPTVIPLLNWTATGSFAGTADLLLGYNVATVFAKCATTTGLSTLPINHLGGDNLLVGPGF